MLRYRNNYNFLFQSHGSQHLINNNTRYKLELKHEIDLLHSFLFPISFLNFPRPSLFPVPLSSLSASLSLSLSLSLFLFSLVTASRHTAVPLPATSIKLPAPPAVADSRYARTWAYRHSHACTHMHAYMRTQTRHVSRQVGIQMDTDVTAVARFSTHRPLRFPLTPGSGTHSAWFTLFLLPSRASLPSPFRDVGGEMVRKRERGGRERAREASNRTNWGIVYLTPCIRGVLSIMDFLSIISSRGKLWRFCVKVGFDWISNLYFARIRLLYERDINSR